MRIKVVMRDGARAMETTRLDVRDGCLLADDYLDVSSLAKDGVLLERSVFTTTSDEMQMLKPPMTLIAPDELDDMVELLADGKPILARTEAGELAPAALSSMLDEEGNFMGDVGEGLCLYYSSGSYETVVPTALAFGDGMLVQDDLVDWSSPEDGVTWARGAWTKGDKGLMELRPEPAVVVVPEQFEHMELVTFQGELALRKTADGMRPPAQDEREADYDRSGEACEQPAGSEEDGSALL